MTTEFRIFFDCHSFDTGWQGTTTYLQGILNSLPEAVKRRAPHIDLKIFCAAHNEENIRRHIQVPFDFVSINSSFLRRNLFDIPRALKNTKSNLVVSQYVRPFFSECPTMSIIHDVLFLDYPISFSKRYIATRRLMFGWSARNSSIISTVSPYSANRISSHFNINLSNILVIPNGVDPLFLKVRRAPPVDGKQPLRLLSVSRLERRKRHEWGIDAMEELRKNGIECEYTIVGGGEGPYANQLRNRIIDSNSNGYRTQLKSGLDFNQLIEEYKKADIFIFPTEAEGFGIPLIEAAATGIPCVTSDGGALADFQGQYSGRSFHSNDISDFLKAVNSVATNLNDFRFDAEIKRKTIKEIYNWNTIADSYANIIQKICEK